MIGVPPVLTQTIVPAVRALSPLPLLAALQALRQGELMVRGMTRHVQTAMVANFIALILVLLPGLALGIVEGTLLAAIGLVVSLGIEVAVLYRHQFTHLASMPTRTKEDDKHADQTEDSAQHIPSVGPETIEVPSP